MHLEVEKTSEEVQTRLFVILAAIRNRFIHEFLRLEHLVELNLLVHIVPPERVGV